MAFMFWLVTVITGTLLVAFLVPYLKNTFREGLYQRGYSVAATVQEEVSTGGHALTGDRLTALCDEILSEQKQVLYLVRTQFDGDSQVQTRDGMREENLGSAWAPPVTETGHGDIIDHPFGQRTAYHFSYVLDGVHGERVWLHVGLSTAKYQRDVQSLYRRTAQVGLVCMTVSLLLSLIYAQRMVKPLLRLQEAVREVAMGDLQVRANLATGDEVEELARCFNEMTLSMEQTHEQLKQAKESAEEASRVKTRFLANMSHEVRTPMNGIMSTMKLLKGTKLSTNQARYIDTALKSSGALLGLLNDILDITKIEAGKMELEQREFSLAESMEHVVRLFQEAARSKGLGFTCIADGSVPSRLWGDDLRLGQILMNLLSNALKFTESGDIVIRAAVVEENDTHLRARISVQDSGIGIPVAKQASLFRRFTQEDSSTTRKYGGSGLGLAISRELVELMDGEIGVDSVPGSGATFWFELPLIRAVDVKGACDPTFPRLGDANVLVMGKDESRMALLGEQLEGWGCEVEYASDAMTVLKKMRVNAGLRYQSVILLDAWGVDEDVAANRRLAEMCFDRQARPVVICSSEEEKERRLSSRVQCDNLSTPVMPFELYAAIGGRPANGCTPMFPDRPPADLTRVIPPGAKARVLLAEDHLVNQEITHELLHQWGYECECASTGKEAVEMVRSREYDLVLMDCQMPEMDGYEATRLIREREGARDTGGLPVRLPIVALTANTARSDQQQCMEAGMDACLSKPLDQGPFRSVVRELLGKDYTTEFSEMTVAVDTGVSEEAEEENPVCGYETLLKRCGGKPDRVLRIVESFAEQTRQDLQTLEQAVGSQDAAEVTSPAHRIKGAAGNLTARALQAAAAELERTGRSGDLGGAEEQAQAVGREFEAFLNAVSAYAGTSETVDGGNGCEGEPERERAGVAP